MAQLGGFLQRFPDLLDGLFGLAPLKVVERFSLQRLLKMPTAKMTDGGMMPLGVSDEDLRVLVAYIEALK